MFMIPMGTPVIPWVYVKHIYVKQVYSQRGNLKADDKLEEVMRVYTKYDWYCNQSQIETVNSKTYVKFNDVSAYSGNFNIRWAYSYHSGFIVDAKAIQFIKETV